MQTKFQSLLRSKPAAAVGLVLTLALAATVGMRNYRSASLDFEPWPGSDLLQHPERTLLPGLQRVWFRSQGTLAGAGFGVLAFDWPGDGASTGEIHWGPAERHALTAAIDWLGTRPDVDPERIGGLGFSMGGYVMAQVAAGDSRLRAVVLEALPPSFDEYLDHLHDKWGMLSRMPARWAVDHAGMDTTALAPRSVVAGISPRPVLIIGGSDDPVISPAMLRELYDAAREPKQLWLVPRALHGGYSQTAAAEYSRRLLAFFEAGLRR